MDRVTIAYTVMLVMIVALAAFIAFKWYHSADRSYRRRNRREAATHAELMDRKHTPRR